MTLVDAPIAAATTLGIASAFNPCGLPLLPAYLSYFLGVGTGEDDDTRASIGRALVVGGAVSAGVAATFAVIGLVVSHVTRAVRTWIPWMTVVIGVGLVVLGIALLAGREVKVSLPRLDKGGRTRRIPSMVLFGVSYAIASIGCTIQLFAAQISFAFERDSAAAAIVTFLAFAAGMSLVLVSLTVALALARHSLVRTVRRALPYVQRFTGALLVPIGVYVAYYGLEERRAGAAGTAGGDVIDTVAGWSGTIQGWVADVGGRRIAVALAAVVGVAVVFAFTRRKAARPRV